MQEIKKEVVPQKSKYLDKVVASLEKINAPYIVHSNLSEEVMNAVLKHIENKSRNMDSKEKDLQIKSLEEKIIKLEKEVECLREAIEDGDDDEDAPGYDLLWESAMETLGTYEDQINPVEFEKALINRYGSGYWTHIGKGKKYFIISDSSKYQVGDLWIDSVVYCDAVDGYVFCREKENFYNKFKKLT